MLSSIRAASRDISISFTPILLTDGNGKSSMNRDIKKIAKWARSQGGTVEDDASGHTRFYAPNGHSVADYPATPSPSPAGGRAGSRAS